MSALPPLRLRLATRLSPTGVAEAQREVTHLPFNIGRAPDNDWALPDPGRVMSKHHCRITANAETWLITDTSSNGTFVNGAGLDPGVPQVLRNGDRLVFGAYEVEALFGDNTQQERGESGLGVNTAVPTIPADRQNYQPNSEASAANRLAGDPLLSLDDDVLEAARPSVSLPPDFDPLTPAEELPESPYAAPDHVPELEANFRPPRPDFELLPGDWDQDPEPHPTPRASPPPGRPVPPQAAPPLTATDETQHQATLDDGQRPAPANRSIQRQPSATLSAPPPASIGAATAFAAFATGAGVASAAVPEPDQKLAALGAAFRTVVTELRRMMIARAAIKSEFRIDQTMIRAAGNNPLKFSADDDDALAALLGTGRNGGMPPAQAIGEALRDIRRHELAVAAAMQHAVRDVLQRLDPEHIMRDASPGTLDRLTGANERRAWQRYTAQHAEVMQALTDDFDSVFGRSFGRAYEVALADLAAQDAETDP